MTTPLRRLVLLPVLLVLMSGSVVLRAAAPALAPEEAAALQKLAAPDYATREQATRALLLDEALSPEVVGRLYAAAQTPEQQQRLLQVALHQMTRDVARTRLGAGQSGAMGVIPSGLTTADVPGLKQPAVRIDRVYPGFPAYAHLKPGDLVVAVDGKSLTDSRQSREITQQFIAAVQAHRPGEAVEMTLYRDGQVMTVQFRLGSREALERMYDVPTGELRADLLARWQELRRALQNTQPQPQPLSVDLPRSSVRAQRAGPRRGEEVEPQRGRAHRMEIWIRRHRGEDAVLEE